MHVVELHGKQGQVKTGRRYQGSQQNDVVI